MQSSITGSDTIDWKKIGHAKPYTENITAGVASSVAVVSVATPQKPNLQKTTHPARLTAVIRHTQENTNQVPTGTSVKIAPVKQQQQNVPNVQKVETPIRKSQSDEGGMEMLDTDFILQVIENVQANEQTDLIMRKIGFYEILRRDLKSMIDSNALKVYAIDEDSDYGKHIQCNAMQELARRTA